MIALDRMSEVNAVIGIVPGSHAISDEDAARNNNIKNNNAPVIYPIFEPKYWPLHATRFETDEVDDPDNPNLRSGWALCATSNSRSERGSFDERNLAGALAGH